MHIHAFVLVSTVLLTACAPVTTRGPTTLTHPTMHVTAEDRENAALAFISYTGDNLEFDDSAVDAVLYFCVKHELERQPLTTGKYRLVWGPAVFRFKDVKLDDNMMYIVERVGHKEMVIATRGTNFGSRSDWIYEDLNVACTRDWPVPEHRQQTPRLNPRISCATHTGLQALQNLKPKAPGVLRQKARDFLRDKVNANEVEKVTVVGHSLAGALAPAFALWLSDTLHEWAGEKRIDIHVTALAGATGGDRQYSQYYDRWLPLDKTRRIHNPYDVVPLAWNEETMKTLPGLYEPDIKAGGFLRFVMQRGIRLAEGYDYTQIASGACSLGGGIGKNGKTSDYIDQISWQHHCGYVCGLGMNLRPLEPCAGVSKPVKCDCKNISLTTTGHTDEC